MSRLLLVGLLCIGMFRVYGEEAGTLIVTYQTGRDAERLDRIRFWLKGENQKQQFFPKDYEFVDTGDDHIRMVVIEDLEPGNYTVQFLVPNQDNRFKKVPLRTVEVVEGGVARLNQQIKVRKNNEEKISEIQTGSLIVFYDVGERGDLLDQVRFSLTDDEGNSFTYPIEGESIEERTTGGLSFTIEDLPAGSYTLDFFLADSEEIPDQESISFEIPPGKTETIHKTLKFSVRSEEETIPAEGVAVPS